MKSILILDDDTRICEELTEFLEHRHYSVFTAEKPSIARKLLESEDIDLVFLDINLPEMNGISFLGEIKRDHPEVRVIMITSNGSQQIQQEAFLKGAENYLRKPIFLSQIQEEINRINKINRREL